MAIPNWKLWNSAKEFIGDGTHDLDDGSIGHHIRCMLSTLSYSNITTHNWDTYGDISAAEVPNGNGYTTGGVGVAGPIWVRSGGTTSLVFGTQILAQWTGSGAGFTAASAVLYIEETVNGIVKPLLAVLTLDPDNTLPDFFIGAGVVFNVRAPGNGHVFDFSGAAVD